MRSSNHWMYIYGIIPSAEPFSPQSAGIDDVEDEVFTIGHCGLSAVVSRTTRSNYQGMDRQDAVQYLLSHQRVLEEMMSYLPILPVKFGTVLPDVSRVERLLEQGEAVFRATFEELAGRVQMEIVVLWDLPDVFQQIAQEDAIVKMKAQVAGRSERETVKDRIVLGQLVQMSLEQRRKTVQQPIIQSLAAIVSDIVINGLMDDSMVLNVAVLLDERKRAELDDLLDWLDGQFGGKYTFRRVGPLPPYSFATVEVTVPCFEQIDAARRCLCLGELCREHEIQKAYHRLASEVHPDHNRDNPDAETQMGILTNAYKLLSRYAQSQHLGTSQSVVSGGWVDFREEVVVNALMLRVSRQTVPA